MLQICKSGKEHGYSTFIALQPMVGTGNKTLSPDEYRFKPHSEHGFAVMRILDEMGKSIDNLGEVCDMAYDLGNVFDNVSEPVFYDDAHVTDYGNEIIAQKLFELSLPLVIDKTLTIQYEKLKSQTK